MQHSCVNHQRAHLLKTYAFASCTDATSTEWLANSSPSLDTYAVGGGPGSGTFQAKSQSTFPHQGISSVFQYPSNHH